MNSCWISAYKPGYCFDVIVDVIVDVLVVVVAVVVVVVVVAVIIIIFLAFLNWLLFIFCRWLCNNNYYGCCSCLL